MKCIRCHLRGTVRVHQIDTGTMRGPQPGPRTADVYACEPHAAEIARLPWAWPWLSRQSPPQSKLRP